MDISQFKSAIKSGILRGHRFRVIVNFPAFAGTTENSRQASLLARSTSTPTSTIGEVELKYGGRTLPIPGDREYSEQALTFIAVQDQGVFNAFQSWSNGINSHEGNVAVSTDLDALMTDLTLQLLDGSDNVINEWVLRGAWPREVGAMEMDAESDNAAVTFEVTLRYINYEITGITS